MNTLDEVEQYADLVLRLAERDRTIEDLRKKLASYELSVNESMFAMARKIADYERWVNESLQELGYTPDDVQYLDLPQ